MHSVTTTGEVKADHTLTITIPTDLPPGPVRVSITVEPERRRGMSPTEFLDSEFFGDWADRQDLPHTLEEFAAWRARIWEGEFDEAS